MKAGEAIEAYIKVRDRRSELQKKHKEELAPYNTALLKLETLLHKMMDEQDLENLKSEEGTAYKSTQSSVTVADWDVFKDYVIENDAWFLFEKRASKTAVEEVLEYTGEMPPGLDIKRTIKINVRRS